MNAHPEIVPSLVDRIKQTLVALKMPRAIEILDVILRRLEHGEITAIEAIDALLAEELTLRENRRIKIALMMARLSSIKTHGGFDFSFQPSLDKNRIMALAALEFIDRSEVVHFLATRRPSTKGDLSQPPPRNLPAGGIYHSLAAYSGVSPYTFFPSCEGARRDLRTPIVFVWRPTPSLRKRSELPLAQVQDSSRRCPPCPLQVF